MKAALTDLAACGPPDTVCHTLMVEFHFPLDIETVILDMYLSRESMH